jgi:hypothetical protein
VVWSLVGEFHILGQNKELLYIFQLLQELKSNDQPHQRDFCINMLNCLKDYSLFLDRIVFSDKATFSLVREGESS